MGKACGPTLVSGRDLQRWTNPLVMLNNTKIADLKHGFRLSSSAETVTTYQKWNHGRCGHKVPSSAKTAGNYKLRENKRSASNFWKDRKK